MHYRARGNEFPVWRDKSSDESVFCRFTARDQLLQRNAAQPSDLMGLSAILCDFPVASAPLGMNSIVSHGFAPQNRLAGFDLHKHTMGVKSSRANYGLSAVRVYVGPLS